MYVARLTITCFDFRILSFLKNFLNSTSQIFIINSETHFHSHLWQNFWYSHLGTEEPNSVYFLFFYKCCNLFDFKQLSTDDNRLESKIFSLIAFYKRFITVTGSWNTLFDSMNFNSNLPKSYAFTDQRAFMNASAISEFVMGTTWRHVNNRPWLKRKPIPLPWIQRQGEEEGSNLLGILLKRGLICKTTSIPD